MGFIALQRAKLHYVFENIFHVVERLVSEKEAKMNKIFKVIWSKSKQCYVVVSELAKNTTGKKKIVVASILATLAMTGGAGQVAQVVLADGAITYSSQEGSIAISGSAPKPGAKATATQIDSIAIGQLAKAHGRGGIAIGRSSSSSQNSVALGWGATGSGYGSIALGTTTESSQYTGASDIAPKSSGVYSISVGAGAQAGYNYSMALGTTANATGVGGVAIGMNSEGAGNSVAAGFNAKARSNNTVAIGVEANNDASGGITNNASSVSVGIATLAKGVGSMAMGVSADASGKYSLALGSGDVNVDYTAGTNHPSASGEKSIAIGYNSNASDLNALAIGTGASVNKQNATAVGSGASVTGHNATAVGNDTKAQKQYDNAFGYTSNASGGAATAVGYYATASGNQTVALGSTINSTAQYATGIGYSVNSQGEGSVAIGAGVDALSASSPAKQVQATRKNAIAIGRATQATGESATAIGTDATASSSDAVAIGRLSNASGGTSISFGYNTKATHTNAVAIGTDVSATEESAIALGRKTKASALNATAVGPLAEASENSASAFGMSATASKVNSVALGSNSTTATNATSQGSVVIGGKTITWNGAPTVTGTGMQVSVGSASAERQIKNVAAGEVSANSTDAINGSQLYAVAEGLRTKYVSINSTVASNQNNDGATGSNSMAIGPNASATKADSVALGYLSTADTAAGVAGYNANTGRSDTYTALSGNVLTSTLGAVSVGNATNTRQITGVAAGTADTDAVNVAQLKSVNLAFTGNTNTGNGGDVNLSNSKLAIEGGTNSFITTEAANKKLEIKTTQGQLKNTAGTVSVNGNNGLAVAQNVADVINQANADQSIKYKANGTGSNSVKLSDGLNFTNGTTTTATVGANGQVSFDLNTATQKSITDSATAVARTISLGGDTGTTTAKSLSSDNVNFGIKSGSPTYLTTKATGNDVTLTINEQAIKNAAKDASSFKVKANATAAEDVKGGDTVTFNDGDNIAITQTGKTFKIATAKNVTFDAATIGGNTTIGSTGVTTNKVTVGTISIDGTNGINAGSKAITNVGTGRVANSNADDTNVANIGDVKAIATDAVANLSTNLGITDGTTSGTVNLKNQSLKVVGTGVAKATVNGQTITVDVAKGTLAANAATGALTGTAGVVDANDMASAVNTAITKAVDNATGTQALNLTDGTNTGSVKLSTQTLSVSGTNGVQATVGGQGITIGLDTATKNLISNSSTAVDNLGKNTFTLKADSTDTTAQDLNKSGGLAFKVAGDGNFTSTSAAGDTVTVSVKQGVFGSNADGTAKSTTNGVATTDKVADIVNTTVSNAVNNVTSNQNLKIGGDTTAANSAVNLKNDTLSVKGDNKYISTAASGNDITLTVNEQAIKDAAKDASSFKVKANSTAAEDVKGGDTVAFNDGDNIAITQTGKTFKIATAKNVTFDAATIGGNTTIGSTGVTTNKVTVGGISIDGTNGINAGSKQITNVASGGTTATNAANIGDVDTKVTTAINDLTTNLTKNTTIAYTANTATPGQTVSLKDGFNFSNGTLTTAEVAANGVVKFNVTQGSLSTDGNGNITNTAGVATTDDVKNAVNTAINKAVSNSSAAVNTLGANTFTLTGDNSTSTTGQALNKNGGLSFKVAGDGNFITTSAATDTVTVSIKQGTFGSNTDGTAKSTTNGVATTNDVANIVNTTVTNAVTKATGSQVLNITDGTNNDSINLKNDTLKVVGADGVTTEVSGKTITVGLDTATKNKINNASTAANRNISLAADSGTTSSQSLKDGDVSFAVKGATGDYISTNMNGSTIEISTKRATINSNAATGEASVTGNDGLATAKNVADAINAATAKAVSQSAWKLAADGTTGTETISGGDTVNFKAGSNMEVSRTGKDITYKTKDNVAFTTVTAGTGANEVKLDGNTGTVTAKDITATGDVTAKNVTTSGNVTAAGTVKGDTVQGNTVKAGNVTITGGTTNTITGLSNTTWTGSTTTPDRAATEGQLQQAISSATSSATFKFDGDNNSQQTMNLQNGTFKVTGDTMITTNATSAGIGLSLNTNNVKVAYAANGTNGQTTSIASGFNFTDGDHTKATVAASGVVKYDAKTSTISVANGHATSSGNDLATADNVADAINQMTQNNSGNTTQLRQEISKVATETQRVGAHAAAMAALKPIQYDPLAPTQIMAGVGNYRGESAAALGIAHYTNDNTMFNVGVSVGGNHNMINAGVTHKFGISAEKKNIPDRYKAGPISSIYVMQDEMTQLRSENEAYKAKLDKQQSEIDALKAAVDQLLASKA